MKQKIAFLMIILTLLVGCTFQINFGKDSDNKSELDIKSESDSKSESNSKSENDTIVENEKDKGNVENNTSTDNKETSENKQEKYTDDELSNMALEYFYKNSTDLLPKDKYSVGIGYEVIPKYENQNMVTIEIRHINDGNNSLDARYFINIYTAKGFDELDNEIDLMSGK